MTKIKSTTVVAIKHNGQVAIGADGQATMGNTVAKSNVRKIRKLQDGKIVTGFAGSTADAFTLLERLEAKLEATPGQLSRACVELAKDWRTDKYLKNLEAHAEHFHVYLIDMVGHGYSDAPDISYDMQCYVDFMRDFVDAIGEDKVYISGESLGATVASWFALAYPDRVHKIVMNTGMMLPPDEEGAKELQDLLDRSRKASGTPNRDMIRQRISL